MLATNLMAGWLFFLVAVLVALLVVGAFSAATAVAGVEIAAGLVAPGVEGGMVAIPLTVEARRTVRFLRVGTMVADQQAELFLPALRRKERRQVILRLAAPRRGVHAMTTLRVTSAGSVGLFRMVRQVAAVAEIIVRPRFRGMAEPLVGTASAGGVARPGRRRGGELFGIREYLPGDAARHIHWRSSARHRRLMVKEFEEPGAPVLALVADVDRSLTPDNLDEIARAAATIAHAALRHGYEVTLLWSGADGAVVVSEPWEQIWTALARLRPEGPPLSRALLRLRPQLPPEAVPVTVGGRAWASGDGAIAVGPAGSGAEWEYDREGTVRWTGS